MKKAYRVIDYKNNYVIIKKRGRLYEKKENYCDLDNNVCT